MSEFTIEDGVPHVDGIPVTDQEFTDAIAADPTEQAKAERRDHAARLAADATQDRLREIRQTNKAYVDSAPHTNAEVAAHVEVLASYQRDLAGYCLEISKWLSEDHVPEPDATSVADVDAPTEDPYAPGDPQGPP